MYQAPRDRSDAIVGSVTEYIREFRTFIRLHIALFYDEYNKYLNA